MSAVGAQMDQPGTLSTRKIVVAGVLGAIAIFLGVTRLGFIPVPNLTANATIMHVPAILGAVLEGPLVGILAGAIFGIFSWTQATTPFFQNPIIAIVPRLLIGLFAWLAYRSLVGVNKDLAAAFAGVVGSLTNSVFVLGLIVLFFFAPQGGSYQLTQSGGPTAAGAFLLSTVPQVIAEAVIAAIITVVVARAVDVIRSGRTTAADTRPREQSHY